MRITASDSPEIQQHLGKLRCLQHYSMNGPKSDLVKLCNDSKYKHSLEKGKHYFSVPVELPNIYIYVSLRLMLQAVFITQRLTTVTEKMSQ